MNTNESIKEVVKEKYGEIALKASSCCSGESSCSPAEEVTVSDDYSKLPGYNPEADLGLGCGLPTQYALIKEGDTVVDLGSGAGNDCFIARALVGEKGRVIGVDMTEAMIDKARKNAQKLGFANVEFRFGEIENLPVADNEADVVVSNCVLNLVPDKRKAFAETHRILKPGGHFSISDIVTAGKLPVKLKQDAAMYVGCVAGALQKTEYLQIIENTGFRNIKLQKEKKIIIPDELLAQYLAPEEIRRFKKENNGIFSVTVYAEKP